MRNEDAPILKEYGDFYQSNSRAIGDTLNVDPLKTVSQDHSNVFLGSYVELVDEVFELRIPHVSAGSTVIGN